MTAFVGVRADLFSPFWRPRQRASSIKFSKAAPSGSGLFRFSKSKNTAQPPASSSQFFSKNRPPRRRFFRFRKPSDRPPRRFPSLPKRPFLKKKKAKRRPPSGSEKGRGFQKNRRPRRSKSCPTARVAENLESKCRSRRRPSERPIRRASTKQKPTNWPQNRRSRRRPTAAPEDQKPPKKRWKKKLFSCAKSG